MIAQLSNPLEKSCSIHPRRLTPSDSLEERIVIAKSSIVASTIPKSQIYYGNRDAYPFFREIDFFCLEMYIVGIIKRRKNEGTEGRSYGDKSTVWS